MGSATSFIVLAVTALQDCILDIKTWMTADKLMLNNDKTELIIIGTCMQLDKISISELSIDDVKMSALCNVRNLGLPKHSSPVC